MKEVAFISQDEGSDETMDETIGVPDGINPREFIENVLKEYNVEEDRREKLGTGYKSCHRKIISIQGETGKEQFGLGHCEYYEKYNNTTIMYKNQTFDVYRCRKCQLLYRRFSIDMPDRSCYPELVCVKCDIQFPTKRRFDNHMKKDIHKMPDWIDFVRNICNLDFYY